MSRIISFAGIINARDLGGLTTTEGETIRKGLLLRAANLSQATDADLAKLRQDYRLSSIIDLRTAVERKEKPDRIPEDVELRIHPIFDEATAGITREDKTSSPFSLPDMVSLYNSSPKPDLEDLLDFHVCFERIHPFQDGNGRVGRLILFKECLRFGIVPFIIDDRHKMFYYRGLKEWDKMPGYLRDTCLLMQDDFKAVLDYFGIEYEK